MNQSGLLIFTFMAFVICSCEFGGSSEVSRSIDDEKMRAVLLDLHWAEADLKRESDWRAKSFSKHEVDSTKFHETLRYYAAHPDSAQEVYDWVQDQLAEKREQILAREREVLRKD